MNQLLHVLVAEDSEDDTLLLLQKLKKAGFDSVYERVDSLDALTAALDKQPWDLIVSDHSMPRLSPIQALETLKAKNLDIPVVIVSGTIEPETAVAAMKAGASDFIMKNDLTRLIPAIERELRESRNRQARRKAEEQFLQAQKMECVGRLACGAAHDFNNILTAIFGYCELMLENMSPEDSRNEDIGEIKKAGERAATLTRQLLAFSRHQVVQMKVLDLNAIVVDMEKMLLRLIGEDVVLDGRLEKNLGRIKSDHGHIEQVILNLAVNARDAMPEGGKIIIETSNTELDAAYAAAHADVAPGPYVLLAVSDTGTGMSQETMARIFEPFFTTKEKGKGTGLGLSTVYDVVNQSKGHISVSSELGKGTTFKVFFPRIMEEVAPQAEAPIQAKIPQRTATIFVADDDKTIRSLIKRVLSAKGYKVHEIKKTQIAAASNMSKPALLITDMVMPGISGTELASRIRHFYPEMKVLYLSGYTNKTVQMTGSTASKDFFLAKPFTPRALELKVQEVLSY